MAEKITRDEYDRKRRHGYAGPKSSLMPQTQENWNGTHWVMRARSNGGTELAPVDVERKTRKH